MTDTARGARRSLAGALSGSAGIALAMGVMNLATYGYTIAAARLLGPRSYGAFAAVMGLLLVVGVLQLGLQATGARRIAAQPQDVAEIERTLLRVSHRSAVGLAALCLVLAPVIDATLHLHSLTTAALVAVTAYPVTLMGGQAGVLQGERRWAALAWLYVAAGVPRLVVGTALIAWRPEESLAVLGVTIGFFVPVAVGWLALRRTPGREGRTPSGEHGERTVLGETARNSHALLAFLALSNADVIVTRTVLSPHESGLYAGGLILVKAVLFLPQFVVIIAFPSMSTESARRSALVRSVSVVLGVGLVATLAARLLSEFAVAFVGGAEYAAIGDQLWRFAVLGTLLSLIQLLVYSVVARQATYSVYLIWAALAMLLVATRAADDVTTMVSIVSVVDAGLFLALLGLSLWRLREPSPA